jgi:hypothetical protein
MSTVVAFPKAYGEVVRAKSRPVFIRPGILESGVPMGHTNGSGSPLRTKTALVAMLPEESVLSKTWSAAA